MTPEEITNYRALASQMQHSNDFDMLAMANGLIAALDAYEQVQRHNRFLRKLLDGSKPSQELQAENDRLKKQLLFEAKAME
jgi:hypothetical protein